MEVQMSALEELQDAAQRVGDRLGPATVSIGRDGRGSGVVIADGQVLTCAHNLRDRTTQVTFADGRTAQGEVLAADIEGDLAVLGVDTGGITPASWAPAPPADGQVVFGVARGQGLRVTFGLVSGTDRTFRGPRGRRLSGSVEHTAPLARGSTGGALADAQGQVVGVNTLRLGDRFALAQPADEALQGRVARLAAGETPKRRRLGVALAPAHVARRLRASVGLPEREGLLVRGVEDGSPAATAGIEAGDLLVRAADRDLTTADDLFAVLEANADAATLTIGVVRGAEARTVEVQFSDEPSEPQANV
jgi:serine protease Do